MSDVDDAVRPFRFLARYVRRRPIAHAVILAATLAAVGCSVGTQYGLKSLIDALSPAADGGRVWWAFGVLVSLIAADNLLWRIAGWVASYAFVNVTGDLRADLFRHLTGHAASYFADRLPGTLTSRVTATSNAAFMIENMFTWNVLPPCVAVFGAIVLLSVVSTAMTAALIGVTAILVVVLFRLAAAGRPLHQAFADKAAAVDGEMVDVVGNLSLVRAFSGLHREHIRFDETVGEEVSARRQSLQYLEKLRLFHAVSVIVLTVAMLAWAILLWRSGGASTGDVVLVCTLGFTILHGTRDLAVALVDMTQHMARLSEALAAILVPHAVRDHPRAAMLVSPRGRVRFETVRFQYPGGRQVFENLTLTLDGGRKTGLIGPSGGGKSTIFALLQRFYDVTGGRILIDDQDIAQITQDSLRKIIAVVPQDVSLLHRSIMDNIRYGRQDASDEDVRRAAAAAKCRDFIELLPQGFATVVGDRGVKLSAGQRQRLAIARALLKDAPIVLLDEATSSLDGESEEFLRETLERLMRGRTVIAIAHRLSTLRNFDRIVVLKSGHVAQDGSPDQLLRAGGPYRDLIHSEMKRLALRAA
jgi:ATP-binding cassette subfamily B protein